MPGEWIVHSDISAIFPYVIEFPDADISEYDRFPFSGLCSDIKCIGSFNEGMEFRISGQTIDIFSTFGDGISVQVFQFYASIEEYPCRSDYFQFIRLEVFTFQQGTGWPDLGYLVFRPLTGKAMIISCLIFWIRRVSSSSVISWIWSGSVGRLCS